MEEEMTKEEWKQEKGTKEVEEERGERGGGGDLKERKEIT